MQSKFDFSEEVKIIPGWAYVLGLILVCGVQVMVNVYIAREPHPPVLAFRIFISIFLSILLFVWSMLLGYVNRDAKRRAMNSALWTLICIFIGNGIGFILYFLLRDPMHATCPKCGAIADSSFTFCTRCRFELRPKCPNCGHGVHAGDLYCASCGADVAKLTT